MLDQLQADKAAVGRTDEEPAPRPTTFRDHQKEDLKNNPHLSRSKRERGSLIDVKRYIYTSAMADTFGRVICDEGHRIKSCRTRTHRAIVATRAEYHWVVSATPMMNRASDLIGYLNFFWRPEWMSDVLLPGKSLQGAGVYGPEIWQQVHPDYRRKYDNLPLYRLDPTIFANLANRAKIKDNKMDSRVQVNLTNAINSILELVQLRRTMATRFTDAQGRKKRIGDQIKAYFISTTEVAMTASEGHAYRQTWNPLKALLGRPGAEQSGDKKGLSKPTASQTGVRDARLYRLFIMLTHDIKWGRFYDMQHRTKAAAVTNWPDSDFDYGATQFFQQTKPSANLPPYADRYSMAVYMMMESPKLRFLMAVPIYQTVFNRHPDGRPGKCIIYCGYPALQWEVECVLNLCGLDFCSLRAGKLPPFPSTTS